MEARKDISCPCGSAATWWVKWANWAPLEPSYADFIAVCDTHREHKEPAR